MAHRDESEDDEEVGCHQMADFIRHLKGMQLYCSSEVADALEARLSTLQHLSPQEAATMLGRMPPRQAGQLASASPGKHVLVVSWGLTRKKRSSTKFHQGPADG